MGVPPNGWFLLGKIPSKWMMKMGVPPWLRKHPYVCTLIVFCWSFRTSASWLAPLMSQVHILHGSALCNSSIWCQNAKCGEMLWSTTQQLTFARVQGPGDAGWKKWRVSFDANVAATWYKNVFQHVSTVAFRNANISFITYINLHKYNYTIHDSVVFHPHHPTCCLMPKEMFFSSWRWWVAVASYRRWAHGTASRLRDFYVFYTFSWENVLTFDISSYYLHA